jgi:hypothetical protein
MIRKTVVLPTVVAILATNGCAVLDDPPDDDWRQGTVIAVSDRSELAQDVDRSCIADRGAATDPVVAVRIRVGRSHHTKAYLPADVEPIRAGDSLLVNPRLCLVKKRRAT